MAFNHSSNDAWAAMKPPPATARTAARVNA
jgi:hypothetical protein